MDSRYVAEAFEKAHKNVLRDIDRLIQMDEEIGEERDVLNFAPMSGKDKYGRPQRCFSMSI